MDVRPLTPDRWDDFADLFTRRGPRGGSGPEQCWCMWWRERGRSAERNRSAMETLVAAGAEPGLLAYDEGGRAVGWISVAPREQYGQLVRSRTYGSSDDEQGVWAIACFWLDPRVRRSGVASALVRAAVEHAAGRGATAIEAYPHRRLPDYMGHEAMFAAAGFEPVREAGPRTVVRYVY